MPDIAKENSCFKEAVCIDAMRVYDSCQDKDCIEDARVLFTKNAQELVDCATNVRTKDIRVITVFLDLQPIPFNRGFYSVDMTFFFDVCLELFSSPICPSKHVNGVAIFNKKVILYGSEGNVKVFSSDEKDDDCNDNLGVPKAVVQVAEPIALSAKLCQGTKYGCNDICCSVPEKICKQYGGEFKQDECVNSVYVTIGIFIVVQIVRNAQMLIPAYDFCIPEKECTPNSDNPCDLFSKIEFPVNEFFPPSAVDYSCEQPEHN